MSALFLRLIYFLVIAFFIGTLAQIITGYRKRPFWGTILLGFIGVVTGDFIAHQLRFPHIIPPVFGISILWSIAGATLFIVVYNLLKGRW